MIPVVLTLAGIAEIAIMRWALGTGDGTSYGGDGAVSDTKGLSTRYFGMILREFSHSAFCASTRLSCI